MFGGAIKRQHKLTRSSSTKMARWNDAKTSTAPSWRLSGQLGGARRRQYVVLIVVVIVVFVVLASHSSSIPPATVTTFAPNETKTVLPNPKTHWERPPTLAKLKQWERDLPQHNLNLPFPEGKSGRYVKFSNQVQRLGWNNAFNEMYAASILTSLLTLISFVAL